MLPEIVARDVGDIWFQQDGATAHTAGETIALLRNHSGEPIISRNGPVNWPSRSCDITSLDFFLWGCVKSKVFVDNPATIQAIEVNITRVIGEIPVAMLGRVIENWTFRMDHVRRSRGEHLTELILKK